MDKIRDKYPYFWDQDDNYIPGSIEILINEIKNKIKETDYIAIKHSEGIDCSEYGDWKTPRQALRDEINMLEQLSI